MSLFDRVMNEEEMETGHKMSGKAGRYAMLKAKREKSKLGKGDDKKMGAQDAGAPMSKAGFKGKMSEGEDMDYEAGAEAPKKDGDMKAKMAALRAKKGKGKDKDKKDKKDMEYDAEMPAEESVEEMADYTRKQAMGDSDSYFSWSMKRKPKSLKVRPKGASWDYNPVPVKPDVNHGKVKISKYRKEDEDQGAETQHESQLDSVAESLEQLRNSIFG